MCNVVRTALEEFDELKSGDEARAVHVEHNQVLVREVSQAKSAEAQRGGKLRGVDWRGLIVLCVMSEGGSVE